MKKIWHSIKEEPVIAGDSVRIAFMARRTVRDNPHLFYTCLESVHLTKGMIWNRQVKALNIEMWGYWDEVTDRLNAFLNVRDITEVDGKTVLVVGFRGQYPLATRIPKIGDEVDYPIGKKHRVVGVRYFANAEQAELHVDVVPVDKEDHKCSNCYFGKKVYYNDDKNIPACKCTNPKFNSPYVSEDGTCYDWHSKNEVKQ